jgi:predicted porin
MPATPAPEKPATQEVKLNATTPVTSTAVAPALKSIYPELPRWTFSAGARYNEGTQTQFSLGRTFGKDDQYTLGALVFSGSGKEQKSSYVKDVTPFPPIGEFSTTIDTTAKSKKEGYGLFADYKVTPKLSLGLEAGRLNVKTTGTAAVSEFLRAPDGTVLDSAAYPPYFASQTDRRIFGGVRLGYDFNKNLFTTLSVGKEWKQDYKLNFTAPNGTFVGTTNLKSQVPYFTFSVGVRFGAGRK